MIGRNHTLASRRNVIAGAVALSSIAASHAFATRNASGPKGQSSDSVRSEFTFSEVKIPMNAANLCPMPSAVAAAVRKADEDIDADPSSANRSKYEAAAETLRTSLASLLCAPSPDQIAIVRNATEANNIIVWGAPLRADDEVLLWEENHPSNNVAWKVRAARDGFSVRTIGLPKEATSADEIVDAFANMTTERTRVIALSHVSNLTGARIDVSQLCARLRRNDRLILIDGAQTFGSEPVNLASMGCDAFSGSIHKWMMGPREVGVLYLSERWIERIWPTNVSLHWGEDVHTDQRGARKFESFGQRNEATIAGSEAAVRFVGNIGLSEIASAIKERSDYIRNLASELGLALVGPSRAGLSSGIVVLAAPDATRASTVSRLYEEFGLACSDKGGGVRLSPHIYNTQDHLERVRYALTALRSSFISL